MASSNDYQQGYLDAQAQIRADLANILRINAVDTGEHNAEVISDRMVRDIFSGVFGVKATDDEFGPEPGLNAEIARALLKVRGDGVPDDVGCLALSDRRGGLGYQGTSVATAARTAEHAITLAMR